MASKRLSLKDIDTIKNMVIQGTAPEDIAKHFKIAISSVHYYKKRFKDEGLTFPNVRGKRPTGSVDIPKNNTFVPTAEKISSPSNNAEGFNFVVNGVTVHITGEAKNINIGKDNMEINF